MIRVGWKNDEIILVQDEFEFADVWRTISENKHNTEERLNGVNWPNQLL